jgi:hypothetical protein
MFDWGYVSEPEPNLNGRRLQVNRGKVIGGSSSVNLMLYTRGDRSDFDAGRGTARRGGLLLICCPISCGRKIGEAAKPLGGVHLGRSGHNGGKSAIL